MSNFKMTGEFGGNKNIRWGLRDRVVEAGQEVEGLFNSLKNSKEKTSDEVELYNATSEYLKKLKKLHKDDTRKFDSLVR